MKIEQATPYLSTSTRELLIIFNVPSIHKSIYGKLNGALMPEIAATYANASGYG